VSPKESFWTGLQGGLLDKKHYLKMGMSVWLFGYLTRSQTALNKAGEGVVNYGHPLTFEQISDDLKGISTRTIRLWTARLRREGYIRTETHSNNGVTFWIMKAKQKTKQPKFANPTETQRVMHSRHNSVGSPENSRHNSVGSEVNSRHPIVPSQNKIPAQTLADVPLAAVSDSPTPKGSTSKNLSYYNNTAAAKTAADLLSPLAKDKSVPRGKSPRELDARRREMLSQAERIKAKYPANGNGLGGVAIA
jgi:hypothetical protein